MPETLCKKYGFDQQGRKRRLALVRLKEPDKQLANQFQHQIVIPHVEKLVDDFYDFLLAHSDTAQFLNTSARIQQVRKTQTDYLLSLGKPVCDVLVVNPVESLWSQIRIGWANVVYPASPEIKKLEEQYVRMFNALQGNQIDFDYG